MQAVHVRSPLTASPEASPSENEACDGLASLTRGWLAGGYMAGYLAAAAARAATWSRMHADACPARAHSHRPLADAQASQSMLGRLLDDSLCRLGQSVPLQKHTLRTLSTCLTADTGHCMLKRGAVPHASGPAMHCHALHPGRSRGGTLSCTVLSSAT